MKAKSRYLPLVLLGPCMVPAMLLIANSHAHVAGVSADTLAGFVGGAAIGLSLVGLVKMRKLDRKG